MRSLCTWKTLLSILGACLMAGSGVAAAEKVSVPPLAESPLAQVTQLWSVGKFSLGFLAVMSRVVERKSFCIGVGCDSLAAIADVVKTFCLENAGFAEILVGNAPRIEHVSQTVSKT